MALVVTGSGDTRTVTCEVDLAPYAAEISGSANPDRTRMERIAAIVCMECEEYRAGGWKLLADLNADKAAAQAVVDEIQAKIDAL